MNHVKPCLEYLEKQPDGKKFVIKIENLNPKIIKKIHIERLIRRRLIASGAKDIPEAKNEGQFEMTTGSKIVIEMDNTGKSSGLAWFQTVHRPSVIELLKLHKEVWFGHEIRTYLMDFTYDDDEYDLDTPLN
jgi:hypothetical protein